jgi:tRNA modification GTPase
MLADRSLSWLLHPPRIAIIGVPNAGKSTLANRQFGQQRSIVADLPGTTRDYVEDFANLGGLPVQLVDTPGLRVAGGELESAAIAASAEQIALADLRILLLDPTQARARQQELADYYPDALKVSGKADLGSVWEGIALSATTGAGIGELEAEIRRRFGCAVLPHARPCVWTQRQRELLMRSSRH